MMRRPRTVISSQSQTVGNSRTLIGGEVPILRPDVLELTGLRVHDLYIARDVLVTISFGELVECLVCNFSNVELVVADGEQVVVEVLEDDIRHVAIGHGRIAQTSAVVQILYQSTLKLDFGTSL